MQKILVLNYYWPPSGGPNVNRWLTYSRLLLEKGYQCYVITVDGNKAAYPVTDPGLAALVPPQVKVFPTDTGELFWIYRRFVGKGNIPAAGLSNEANPTFLQKVARFIRGNFFLPDPRRGWNSYALRQARKLLATESFHAIVTAGPPHSTHLVGLQLQKEFGVPWVADFLDFWTDVFYLEKFYRLPLAHQIDKWYERTVLRKADRVLIDCYGGRELLISKVPEQPAGKFHVITVAYDAEKFDLPEQLTLSTRPQTELVITYTGSIAPYYHPESFFRALGNVASARPEIPFRLRFVGVMSEAIRQMIREAGIEHLLEVTGYLRHEDSVKQLYSSSALFVITPSFKSERLHIPGKFYEYLAAGKPIISVSPANSEMASILAGCRAGRNFTRVQQHEMETYLDQLATEWQVNRTLDLPKEIPPQERPYYRYSYQDIARKLAGILDGMKA